jgi:hypothetical protein
MWLTGKIEGNIILGSENFCLVYTTKDLGDGGRSEKKRCCAVNSFLVYTTKDLGDGGRSEEKMSCAVNSKQKSTKNLFLACSFLMC